jgi:hypothetical protein
MGNRMPAQTSMDHSVIWDGLIQHKPVEQKMILFSPPIRSIVYIGRKSKDKKTFAIWIILQIKIILKASVLEEVLMVTIVEFGSTKI